MCVCMSDGVEGSERHDDIGNHNAKYVAIYISIFLITQCVYE